MLSRFFERPFTFDRVARIVFTLLIIGVVLWGVGEVSAVLVPFFMAWLCAYLLMPVVRFFEQRLKIKSRGLSLLIVLLLLGGILTGIVAIVVPSITEEAKKAWELMQYYDLQGWCSQCYPRSYGAVPV